MIVQSIRLQNIKSYADGPDGQGVTISFEPGTNRIAGKNGHGKTTVIESLGYALFLTEPIFEESFHLDTYFLRAGKKAAEIDVTFSHRGDNLRLDAQTLRRSPPPSSQSGENRSPVESSLQISARSGKGRIPDFRSASFYHAHFSRRPGSFQVQK